MRKDAMTPESPPAPPMVTVWSIVRFNRLCYAAAFLWIGAALFLSLRWSPHEFPLHEAPEKHDFSQFYMGGLIARHGAWNDLYPIPHSGSLNSPGAWEYSEVKPEYRRLAEEAGVPEKSSRYIQPPPFALMLEPLGFLKYRAAKQVWNLLMVLCAWGVAVMAGRSYELAARRRSPLAGAIALLVAVSPLTLDTLRLMNVSPFIALLIGFAAFSLICKHSEGGALALVVGAASKYALAILLPLYIAMRKWRSIAVMGIATVAIIGFSLAMMKTGPFVVFLKEMLPTFGRPHTDPWNRSIFGLLMQMAGPHGNIKPLTGMWRIAGWVLQYGTLLGLLAILFTRKIEYWRDPAHIFAGAAALLCWFLIFSPILWDHYFFYLVPLWGWLIWEARRSWLAGIVVAAAIGYQCLPDFIIDLHWPARFSLNGQRITLAGPYECAMLLAAVAIFAVAIARLFKPVIRAEAEPQERRTTFSFTNAQFNHLCAGLAALWLLAAVPASLRNSSMWEGDFPQFYMGGVMARLHAWDSLYPIPDPASHNNAGMPDDSNMRPRYAQEAMTRGVGDRLRFIQPPPVALLLMPLGYLGYHRAFELWTLMLGACGWGVALLAGKLHDILRGETTKTSGLVVLLVACSPLMLHAIRVANMTVGVALLIGISIIEMVRRKPAISALAIVLGMVTKYITLALLPLVFVTRRWKLLAWSAVFGSLLGAASFSVMTAEPFKTYQREIAPTLTRTHDFATNQSIPAFLGRVLHQKDLSRRIRWTVLAIEAITLAALLWLLLRKPPAYWEEPAHVFAAAMALLTFMLIFSPVFWEHYPVYLCPLWGWLVYEGRRSWGFTIGAVIAIGLTYVPWTALMDLREPLNTHILPSALLMMGLAVWRLCESDPLSPGTPGERARVRGALEE